MNKALPDLNIDSINCNILLIGKTGAGKSTFANYLFGVEKFTTGSGEPVTKWEENFQQYNLNISDIRVNIFDSVGLEPNNFEKWMYELTAFLSERQVVNRNSILSANNIMHVLFYFINGASARFLDQEKEILLSIKDKYKLPITLIITNCDMANETQIISIENEAKKIFVETIRVSSVSRKTRGNEKKEQFGKEAALKKILESSFEKVGRELTIVVINEILSLLSRINRQINEKIDNSNISLFNISEIEEKTQSLIDDLDCYVDMFENIENILPKEYISYHNFIESFSIEYQGYDILEHTFSEISDIIDSFDVDNLNISKTMNKALEDIENGSFVDKVGAVLTIGSKLLFLKNTLKEGISEIFSNFTTRLRKELRNIEDYNI